MENQFGKLSKLQLTAVRKDDRTILGDVYFTAPFKIMRPFYEKEDFMTVMLLTASAGIMAGDRQEFDLLVKENAKMEFVSQAYEKIHQMKEGCAKRETHIMVEPNACLYYTPLPTIPFAESDYRSTMEVELADETSKFVLSEVLTCGRVAHGEEFRYHRFQNKIVIYQGGKLVYRDNTRYEPEWIDMQGLGMYEGYTHLANLVICNEEKTDEWIGGVRELLDGLENIEGGVTRTKAGHVVVRMLGKNAQKLTDVMGQIILHN